MANKSDQYLLFVIASEAKQSLPERDCFVTSFLAMTHGQQNLVHVGSHDAAPFHRKGLSLIEILMGMVFLCWALLGYMSLTSSNNKGAMDAYYELQAFQVAQEPIEILQAFGYRWVKANYGSSHMNTLGLYPHRLWHDINPHHATNYPAEVDAFQRYIDVIEVSHGDSKGLQVTVSVKPKEQSRAMAWLTGGKNISLTALILEQPQ